MTLYETEHDLKNQRHAMERVETLLDCSLEEIHRRYTADWLAFRNKKPVALLEYKRRKYDHDQFPTIFLEFHKYTLCNFYARTLDVPFIYVNEFDDLIGMVTPTPRDILESKIGVEASMYRNNSDDSYIMIHLPVDRFTFYPKK